MLLPIQLNKPILSQFCLLFRFLSLFEKKCFLSSSSKKEKSNPFVHFFLLRATALLLSVSHLVLVTRNACHMSGSMDWIEQSLHAAEDHMVVLHEAALASEPERSIPDAHTREQAI